MKDGKITLYDNAANRARPNVHSRGLVVRLDKKRLLGKPKAQIVGEFTATPPVLGGTQGNVQTLPDGGVMVGWGGSIPRFTEFDDQGNTTFEARFLTPGHGDLSRIPNALERHAARAARHRDRERPSTPADPCQLERVHCRGELEASRRQLPGQAAPRGQRPSHRLRVGHPAAGRTQVCRRPSHGCRRPHPRNLADDSHELAMDGAPAAGHGCERAEVDVDGDERVGPSGEEFAARGGVVEQAGAGESCVVISRSERVSLESLPTGVGDQSGHSHRGVRTR